LGGEGGRGKSDSAGDGDGWERSEAGPKAERCMVLARMASAACAWCWAWCDDWYDDDSRPARESGVPGEPHTSNGEEWACGRSDSASRTDPEPAYDRKLPVLAIAEVEDGEGTNRLCSTTSHLLLCLLIIKKKKTT
jgi:hypothetical protein